LLRLRLRSERAPPSLVSLMACSCDSCLTRIQIASCSLAATCRNETSKIFRSRMSTFSTFATVQETIEDFAALQTFRATLPGVDGTPEQVRSAAVSTNFFQMMGGAIVIHRLRRFHRSKGKKENQYQCNRCNLWISSSSATRVFVSTPAMPLAHPD
jgi:hypothetical protein